MTMKNLSDISKAEYESIKSGAANILKMYAAEGVSHLDSEMIRRSVQDSTGLPEAGERLLRYFLMFPNPTEFLGVCDSYENNISRLATYFGRSENEIIEGITTAKAFASYENAVVEEFQKEEYVKDNGNSAVEQGDTIISIIDSLKKERANLEDQLVKYHSLSEEQRVEIERLISENNDKDASIASLTRKTEALEGEIMQLQKANGELADMNEMHRSVIANVLQAAQGAVRDNNVPLDFEQGPETLEISGQTKIRGMSL